MLTKRQYAGSILTLSAVITGLGVIDAPEAHAAPQLAEAKPLTVKAQEGSQWSPRRFHPILGIYRKHDGTDYRASCGRQVIATHSGTVSRNSNDPGGYGWWVELKQGNNTTRYAHLQSRSGLKAGSQVHTGQLIGHVGSTGGSTGCHLHYEQRRGGRSYNAAPEVRRAKQLNSPIRVTGAIGSKWNKAQKSYGAPTGNGRCGLKGGGCVQNFKSVSIHWSPGTGAHATKGGVRNEWRSQGWESGPLGYPTSDERSTRGRDGVIQSYQGGEILWSPRTGAAPVLGGIGAKWKSQGWERGDLGFPRGAERCGLKGGGCVQTYTGGSIHWSKATGAHITKGGIAQAWRSQNWESGRLGYPTSEEYRHGSQVVQDYEGGRIVWSKGAGASIEYAQRS